MSLKRALVPLAVVAALGIAACGDDDDDDSGSVESQPTVSFVSPTDGEMTGDRSPRRSSSTASRSTR